MNHYSHAIQSFLKTRDNIALLAAPDRAPQTANTAAVDKKRLEAGWNYPPPWIIRGARILLMETATIQGLSKALGLTPARARGLVDGRPQRPEDLVMVDARLEGHWERRRLILARVKTILHEIEERDERKANGLVP